MGAQVIKTKPVPDCPECEEPMVLRRPKLEQNWDPFWGCSQFPKCRGTRNIDPVTGEPEDDDDRYEQDGWEGWLDD